MDRPWWPLMPFWPCLIAYAAVCAKAESPCRVSGCSLVHWSDVEDPTCCCSHISLCLSLIQVSMLYSPDPSFPRESMISTTKVIDILHIEACVTLPPLHRGNGDPPDVSFASVSALVSKSGHGNVQGARAQQLRT
ncbi:hypothetical protein M011DRAFT_236027 [Sporormia fimetaria CBS 119925]|uniref:Secreted protein n=1 Tax=Sporormia fimetaria CBS 119925 TaxID=1340428 RepID=A0A6A6VI19_9PLEO|nr:hypothetical protein M011DRAFT_236027 [Sporormia fimetaria CBS 119925]